jgi:hypothetical protein
MSSPFGQSPPGLVPDELYEGGSRTPSSDEFGSNNETLQLDSSWDAAFSSEFQLGLSLDQAAPWQQSNEYEHNLLNDIGSAASSAPFGVTFDQPSKPHDQELGHLHGEDYDGKLRVGSANAPMLQAATCREYNVSEAWMYKNHH